MNGVHQKQDKALVTEGEMGRFTKEDIGYLAMKQVSEGKVRAPLRTTSTRTRLEHSLRCGADGPEWQDIDLVKEPCSCLNICEVTTKALTK